MPSRLWRSHARAGRAGRGHAGHVSLRPRITELMYRRGPRPGGCGPETRDVHAAYRPRRRGFPSTAVRSQPAPARVRNRLAIAWAPGKTAGGHGAGIGHGVTSSWAPRSARRAGEVAEDEGAGDGDVEAGAGADHGDLLAVLLAGGGVHVGRRERLGKGRVQGRGALTAGRASPVRIA
jgi:hypothetical protein